MNSRSARGCFELTSFCFKRRRNISASQQYRISRQRVRVRATISDLPRSPYADTPMYFTLMKWSEKLGRGAVVVVYISNIRWLLPLTKEETMNIVNLFLQIVAHVSIGRKCSIQYFLNRSSMGKDIAASIIFALLSCSYIILLSW